jgi:hydrogenase maturation protease
VEVADFGIRGVHLAHELLAGCELLVLVDAAPHGAVPGTVSVLEVEDVGPAPPVVDAHGLAPHEVLALLSRLGGRPVRTLVVAGEPADLSGGMELSPPLRAAVPHAVRAVEAILAQHGRGDGEDADQVRQAGPVGGGGDSGRAGPAGHPAVPADPEDVMRRA